INDAGENPARRGNRTAEARASRVGGEILLRTSLSLPAGDVEVGIKQQRVSGRNRVGNGAEEIGTVVTLDELVVVERLFDRGGLEPAGTIGIHGEVDINAERPLKRLEGRFSTL